MIATRTRDALRRAKARGVKLGGPRLAQARKEAAKAVEANADRHAANLGVSDALTNGFRAMTRKSRASARSAKAHTGTSPERASRLKKKRRSIDASASRL